MHTENLPPKREVQFNGTVFRLVLLRSFQVEVINTMFGNVPQYAFKVRYTTDIIFSDRQKQRVRDCSNAGIVVLWAEPYLCVILTFAIQIHCSFVTVSVWLLTIITIKQFLICKLYSCVAYESLSFSDRCCIIKRLNLIC